MPPRAHLTVEHLPGRYVLHDLLRAYATEQAHAVESGDERHAAAHRMLDHYLHTAQAADQLLYPTREPITITAPRPGVSPEAPVDHGDALAWFTSEYQVLLAAVDEAAAAGFDRHTWQLPWTLVTFLDRRGHWHDLAATQRAALAAARRLPDPTAQAYAHRLLAFAYLRLGRHDDAQSQLRHALDLFGQTGDRGGQAHTHHLLAEDCDRRGRPDEALHHARQALDLYRAAGHQRGQANALNAIGWMHVQLGDHQPALAACEQALVLFRQLDDSDGQANAWDSLGYAHHHLGQHTQAVTCYQQAVDLYRSTGDRYFEADTLTHLGDSHRAAGDPQAARAAYQQALTIFDELDRPEADQVRTKVEQLND